MQIRILNRISQCAIVSSFLLLVDSENVFYVYSIHSTPKLLFETTEFQHDLIRVHSLASSFFIIVANSRQLFQIDTERPLKLRHVADIKFECSSLLSTLLPERLALFILSNDHSMLAIWDYNENKITCSSTQLDKTMKIEKLYALPTDLVLYDHNQRVHLWRIGGGNKKTITLERADILEIKSNRLVLLNQTVNKLIIYDVKEMLRGEIRLKIPLSALCLTDDGKYLIGLSSKESILLMYQVNNCKLLEKLFVEHLTPLIQATKDRFFLCRNSELILMSVAERSTIQLKRLEINKLSI